MINWNWNNRDISLRIVIAYEEILNGRTVIPLFGDFQIDETYQRIMSHDPSYKIDSVARVNKYFSEYKRDVGYIENGEVIQIKPESEWHEYKFFSIHKKTLEVQNESL